MLELLAEPRELYRTAGKHARQILNRTFFRKIYLDDNDDGPYAASDELADTVQPVIEVAKNLGLHDRGQVSEQWSS